MAGRVVLVEKDEELQTNIVKSLRARGVGVDAFSSHDDVVRALERGVTWARGLFALELDGVDGARLAEVALAHLPELDVIFLTGGGVDAEVLCRAHALGAVIWKPIGLGLLCERLASPPRRSGVVRKVREGSSRRAGQA
ncbi:MAG: response regulator [Polyangiales bacterium]